MKSDSIDNIFMEKYEKYSKMLFRIAFFQLGSTHDAEDAFLVPSGSCPDDLPFVIRHRLHPR